MIVNASPERVRLTYLPDDVIASEIFGIMGALAFILTLIGLSGLLAGCLSRYSFNASALLKLLPPSPEQDAIENPITEKRAIIAMPRIATISLIVFFIKTPLIMIIP